VCLTSDINGSASSLVQPSHCSSDFSKFLVSKPERNTWGFQVMWSVVSSLILFPPLLCALGMRHVWMYEIYVPCATRIASQTASSSSRVGFIVLWGYTVILTDLGRGEIFMSVTPGCWKLFPSATGIRAATTTSYQFYHLTETVDKRISVEFCSELFFSYQL
jgi:hypothetical protein